MTGRCHIYSCRTLSLSTILQPHYHTAWPHAHPHLTSTIESLHVSAMGTIALLCVWSAPHLPRKLSSIHVYNINGRLLCSQRCASVNGLRISHCNEFLVAVGQKSIAIYRLAK